MRLDSKQNGASNSQLSEKRKNNRAEKNCFTNTRLSCKTKEIISKSRDKCHTWNSSESLLEWPRESTFTIISLQIHQCFAYLFCSTQTKARENWTCPKDPPLETRCGAMRRCLWAANCGLLVGHTTGTRGTEAQSARSVTCPKGQIPNSPTRLLNPE